MNLRNEAVEKLMNNHQIFAFKKKNYALMQKEFYIMHQLPSSSDFLPTFARTGKKLWELDLYDFSHKLNLNLTVPESRVLSISLSC